ncbi:MAG TPA: histidinol dehydrogenase, partial [Fimbriimonas sp.]|nr:histidinol dehydrogenase [Fimbriimonas sp.]
RSKLEEVLEQIGKQMEGAPRASIMREALGTGSMALLARNLDEAGELVNAIAPEHLTVSLPDPDSFVARVSNAGCILLGDWTPESAADYCIGPCHTLPTQTAARFAGPLNVMDFLKFQSFACLTKEQLEPLSRVVEAFGALEGFPAHARGATIRY